MKKVLTLLFITFFMLLNINITYSNNKVNSKKITYLIKYVNTKTNDLEKIRKKYNLENDKNISLRLKKLREIKKILIKTEKTWEYNNYIWKLIKQLKINNTLIKEQLKAKITEQKKEAKKYSILYYKKIKPAIEKINIIVINIAKKLMKKERLNYKDRQIVGILILIKQKLNRLETITENKWNTKKEIRDYIMSNFKQITYNFRQIKDIIKKH